MRGKISIIGSCMQQIWLMVSQCSLAHAVSKVVPPNFSVRCRSQASSLPFNSLPPALHFHAFHQVHTILLNMTSILVHAELF